MVRIKENYNDVLAYLTYQLNLETKGNFIASLS